MTVSRRLPFPVLLVLCLAVTLPATSADLRAQDGTSAEKPVAEKPAKEKPASEPLTQKQIEDRLRRAEHNLVLHGLSLDLNRHLLPAFADYRSLYEGMTADPPTVAADDDQTFTTCFALVFAMARAPVPDPSDQKLREEWKALFQDAVNRAELVNPEFPGIQVVAGMMEVGLGDLSNGLRNLDEGLHRLESVTGLEPWQSYQLEFFGRLARGEARLHPIVGREDLALVDFERCEALAKEALKDPITPQGSRVMVIVRTYLAAACQSLAYYERSERILDGLISADPGNPLHKYNRGLVAAWQQKFDEALFHYKKAIGQDRSNPVPRLKVAYILLVHPPGDKGPDVKAALRHAEAYKSLTGRETSEYCACRGEAALAEGDPVEAEKWFLRALELDPQCRHALNEVIKLMGRRRDGLDEKGKIRLKELHRRLNDLMKIRRGDGMESAPADITFC